MASISNSKLRLQRSLVLYPGKWASVVVQASVNLNADAPKRQRKLQLSIKHLRCSSKWVHKLNLTFQSSTRSTLTSSTKSNCKSCYNSSRPSCNSKPFNNCQTRLKFVHNSPSSYRLPFNRSPNHEVQASAAPLRIAKPASNAQRRSTLIHSTTSILCKLVLTWPQALDAGRHQHQSKSPREPARLKRHVKVASPARETLSCSTTSSLH